MNDSDTVVVVGGGLAAAKLVEDLRLNGHRGRVTVLAAEPHLPYERPPLSKALLLGTQEPESVFVHDQAWYDEHEVTVRQGTRVTGLDLSGRRVLVADEAVGYDRLVLATGCRPRQLPGIEPGLGVTLRTLDDSLALKPRLSGTVVLIGAGWIGLEVASAARQQGAEVVVVEPTPVPLGRVLGDTVAGTFASLHTEHGVDLRLETTAKAFRRDGEQVIVDLSDGSTHRADLVVVGIGVVPDDALAREAGLACDNGILVDARLRASDPQVLAVGDVANHDHPVLGRIRVEHWDNAIEQGKHAAAVLLGSDEPYVRLPYFYTDQYDLGMEYVGSTVRGFDEVVIRGDLFGDRVFNALWLRGDQVVAGMHANDWDAIDHLRRLVGRPVTGGTRDRGVPLADL